MRSRTIGYLAAAVAAVGLGVAACGGDDESVADAEANACSSLAGFASEVVEFRGLNPGSSKSDIQSAADGVQSAWDQVKSDASDLAEADTSALDSAQSDLQDAVQSLPDDTTVADAIPQLEPQLQAVGQTLVEIAGGLNCVVDAVTGTTESG